MFMSPISRQVGRISTLPTHRLAERRMFASFTHRRIERRMFASSAPWRARMNACRRFLVSVGLRLQSLHYSSLHHLSLHHYTIHFPFFRPRKHLPPTSRQPRRQEAISCTTTGFSDRRYSHTGQPTCRRETDRDRTDHQSTSLPT